MPSNYQRPALLDSAGVLDPEFTPLQSPLGEPEDAYQRYADTMRQREAEAVSEIDRIKNDKWGKIFNAIGAFGAGISGRDTRPYSLQNRLQPHQEVRDIARQGEADAFLQRHLMQQKARSNIGTYNPRDYTAKSWAEFLTTRDPSVLERYDAFTQGNARWVPDGQGGYRMALDRQQLTTAGAIQAEIDRLNERMKEIGKGEGRLEVGDDITDMEASRAQEIEVHKNAAAESKTLFDQVKAVRSALPNYDEAIKAIDDGASSGVIESKMPSFRASTIRLQNAADRLGLDVISSVTFGALSEAEMDKAMTIAMPNLPPPELRQWLTERKEAQRKLADYLEDAAIFLETGTQAEWAEKMRRQAARRAPAPVGDIRRDPVERRADTTNERPDPFGLLGDN